ncbi:hypothetical protein KQI63_07940 [bacterium]|nr:hypothetical protein [bacterium]
MRLLEVEFKGRRKGIFQNPQEFPLRPNDMVIVQADRGEDIGRISLVGDEWQTILNGYREDEQELEPVLRLAAEQDMDVDRQNRQKEKEARPFFLQQVRDLNLEMKLVDAEYQFDGRKLTFYFTADGRVDFRELVKTLAHHFRTRIDLRQIGARDEAKRLGGIGLCGRELCCSTWIREFKPVTTSMLKEQNLLLNPQKNTGLCGKLRCCLRYEVDQYREINRLFPKADTKVKGPRGYGIVEKVSMCHSSLGVRWEDGARIGYSFEQIRTLTNWDAEKRDEIKMVEFSSDPSIVVEEKENREGHLVTSYDPEKGDKRTGLDRAKGKDKEGGRSKRSGGRKGGSKNARGDSNQPKKADDGTPSENKDGSSRRRGRSRGRGRGRSKGGDKPQGAPKQNQGASPTPQGGNVPQEGKRDENTAKKSGGKNRPRSRGRRGGKPQNNDSNKQPNQSGNKPQAKANPEGGKPNDSTKPARPPRGGSRRRKR